VLAVTVVMQRIGLPPIPGEMTKEDQVAALRSELKQLGPDEADRAVEIRAGLRALGAKESG
jgi:hypothetical protein